MSEIKPTHSVTIGGEAYEFFGKPEGLVRLVGPNARLVQSGQNDGTPQAHQQAVVNDVMETVLLALYSKGALTAAVVEAMNDAADGLANNFDSLGEVGMLWAADDPYAGAAKSLLANGDLQVDGRTLVSGVSSNGAFVQSWSWVSDSVVAQHFQNMLAQNAGDNVEEVLEELEIPDYPESEVRDVDRLIEVLGVKRVYELLSPHFPAQEGPVDRHTPTDSPSGY